MVGIVVLSQGTSIYCQTDQSKPAITVLAVGKSVERDIKSGETHVYEVNLQSGEFVRGTVDQIGVTINVKGFFPDGTFMLLGRFASPLSLRSKLLVSNRSGNVRICVLLCSSSSLPLP